MSAQTAVRYRWVVLAAGCLGTMVMGALRQGMPALGPELREVFGLTLGEVGIVFAAIAVGFTVGLVPWGALADRRGERLVLGTGLVLTAGAVLGAALAPSFGVLVAALFTASLLGSSAAGSSGRAIMGWFARSERGFVLGIRQTAIPVGGAIAALSLPAIAIAADLRTALLVLAGFTLVAGVVAGLLMRDPPRTAPPAGFVAPPPTRDRRIWRLGVGSGLFVVAQASVLGFSVLFLVDEHGLAYGQAALVLAAIQLGSAVGRIVVGRWSDRVDRRIEPLRATGVAGAALVGVMALLSGAPNLVLIPLLVVGGAAMSSWNGLSFTAAAEIAGRARAGTAMSLQNTCVSIAAVGASPLFGALVEHTSYQAGFLAVAAAPLVGWWVLRPLAGDEDERVEARRRRLAAVAGVES